MSYPLNDIIVVLNEALLPFLGASLHDAHSQNQDKGSPLVLVGAQAPISSILAH